MCMEPLAVRVMCAGVRTWSRPLLKTKYPFHQQKQASQNYLEFVSKDRTAGLTAVCSKNKVNRSFYS